MDTKNLAALYDLPTMEWNRIEARLTQGVTQGPETGGPDRHTHWLATINPDGAPQVTAVGALWADGAFWFQTGPQTRKARNLARDPRCSMSISAYDFDLTVNGEARLVSDPATVIARAAQWADGGWPVKVEDSGSALTAEYSAPSAGPPPWYVYRLEPDRATALLTTEPGGATTWKF
jgi:PPOX class probable F420-dependent enzyme